MDSKLKKGNIGKISLVMKLVMVVLMCDVQATENGNTPYFLGLDLLDSNDFKNDPDNLEMTLIQEPPLPSISNFKNQTNNQTLLASSSAPINKEVQTVNSNNQTKGIKQENKNLNIKATNGSLPANQKKELDPLNFQRWSRNHKMNKGNAYSLNQEKNPEYEYDSWDPEPDKNTWDSQAIKYPTATDYRKRFRTKNFSWWQPTYEKKLEDYQEKFLKYGYKGEGFKAGNYYTKYVSNNPKFYTKDKMYGTEIYTPFWNHMRNKYQQVDCGIDCEYLGPKDYLGNMLIYVIMFVVFIIIASLAACNKQKYDQERQIERAREFGQNILQL